LAFVPGTIHQQGIQVARFAVLPAAAVHIVARDHWQGVAAVAGQGGWLIHIVPETRHAGI
jgi:hypothetical protein